jgi:class 3 adenylate cyclase
MLDQQTEAHWSEHQLWNLIDERMAPEADVESIDQRIWEMFGSEWSVMATDLSGFSRRVSQFGIMHFLQLIQEFKRRALPIVASHDGLLVKSEADSLLILFRSPQKAVDCALEMQDEFARLNAGRAPEHQILLCVGIGHGEVLRIGEADVFGHEVNSACKLGEDTAGPGDILVTDGAWKKLADDSLSVEPLDVEVPGVEQAFRLVY